MKRTPKWFVRPILAIALLSTTGCWESRVQAQSQQTQRREYQEQGTQGGVPFEKTGTETVRTEATSESQTKSGIDEEAVARLIVSGVRAATAAAAPALGLGTGEIVTGAGGLLAAVMAVMKTIEANRHRRNEDEAYEKYEAELKSKKSAS